MWKGIIAGWVFILGMIVIFGDRNLSNAICTGIGACLGVVIFTIPVWVPIVLFNKNKRKNAKEKMVEIVDQPIYGMELASCQVYGYVSYPEPKIKPQDKPVQHEDPWVVRNIGPIVFFIAATIIIALGLGDMFSQLFYDMSNPY